jgi:succinate dehydrogenase / fumarate reductase membrane anchor subunit
MSATTTTTGAAQSPAVGGMRRRVALPEKSLETRIWQFMRISGVALIPLAFGHLAIMHVINSVHDMNLCFVAARWDLLAWRIYDAALLGFAMLHGMSGLRTVAEDYVHQPGLQRIIRLAILLAGGAVILMGAIALIGGVRLVDIPANCI